ncbi:hypothetical protein ABLU29_07005 [Lactococcus lactis]|uniref:hypothetical protein n=1 Tax=Lactococcus lactis TaxID=1358 RepID=UPI00387824AB
MAQEKENFYHEALVVLSGMGIKSNNKVMMPNGVSITVQEYLKEKLRYGENLPDTTDKNTVKNLQERCDRYEKALTEIDMSRYGMQFRRDRNPNLARQALAAIGGNDE